MGVLDMALWDPLSKINEVPLYRLLADRYNEGQVDEKIFVYGAGGFTTRERMLTAFETK